MKDLLNRKNVVRWMRLLAGLGLASIGIALMIRASIGLGPWDVLHQGISIHTGWPMGRVSILVGALLMISWFPLGERPGPGTLLNIVLIGLFLDLFLGILPTLTWLPGQIFQMVAGIVVMGVGSGLYLSASLGAGPRDGLMMALVRRTGLSVRMVRTGIELVALGGGWALGGSIGIGTLAFALGVGPVVQLTLQVLGRE